MGACGISVKELSTEARIPRFYTRTSNMVSIFSTSARKYLSVFIHTDVSLAFLNVVDKIRKSLYFYASFSP